MDVSEFAERVVFGTSLDDKLSPPRDLTADTAPKVKPSAAIDSPGRPPGMQIRSGRGETRPPSEHQLDNDRSRGVLLHFLTNHELLATELMALALLKFPEAPPAFRRGVLVTLQEEQEHTRLYLERMRQCGVEFGSYPLSGHFWRVVESMQTPMDFVSRLSLTFEQANLDYSLHFADRFRQVDDIATAEILERIYQDEISHVRHGLHWLQQWKSPADSDWEAYRRTLQFPMSPQRGRGPSCEFNREGRRQAGLSDHFIDEMEVFRQSRGRPPIVRWFDAGAEAELSGPADGKEKRLLQQLSMDLEGVMVTLAKPDDVQLVRKVPSVSFRKRLLDAGLELPEFIAWDDRSTLQQRKLNRLSPWAWTPRAIEIQSSISGEILQQKPAAWRTAFQRHFRKSWAVERVSAGMKQIETPAWLKPPQSRSVVSSTAEIMKRLKDLAPHHEWALFKGDLATSGRHQRRIPCSGLRREDHLWLQSLWKRNAVGVLEPELQRLIDLSFLWDLTDVSRDQPTTRQEGRFLGWTRPLVTDGRRYCGTRLHRPFEDCDGEVKRFLLANNCERLHQTVRWIETHIVDELIQDGFRHLVGVDALVHRDAQGELAIHPCVEVNPRCTMGHVALALRKFVAPATTAEFRIYSIAEWKQIPHREAAGQMEKSADGRWRQGLLGLTEVTDQTLLVPAIHVHR